MFRSKHPPCTVMVEFNQQRVHLWDHSSLPNTFQSDVSSLLPTVSLGWVFIFLTLLIPSCLISSHISSHRAFPGHPAFPTESCYAALSFYFLPVSNFLHDKIGSPHSGQEILSKRLNDSSSWVSQFIVDEYEFSFTTKRQQR